MIPRPVEIDTSNIAIENVCPPTVRLSEFDTNLYEAGAQNQDQDNKSQKT